jgi:membrane protease YdiL (CAAX protease family)
LSCTKGKFKSCLIIILFIAIGLVIMSLVQILPIPHWLKSVLVLLVFILVNLIAAKLFKLEKELKEYWSFRKIIYLLIGIFVGGLIVSTPVLVGLIAKKCSFADVSFNISFTVMSMILTLVIVTWEELWFRGIFLNYCRKYLSSISISIAVGLVFMLAHSMNPKINLLETGLDLFFAGAFLTVIYFYFKTIWLPIGVHFGNNFLQMNSPFEHDLFWGNEGYLSAVLLAVLFLIFVKLTIDKNQNLAKNSFSNV